jgi:peptidyl-prolyl cis-trans isomerase SurA
MDKISKMQYLILSDVRSVAHRLFTRISLRGRPAWQDLRYGLRRASAGRRFASAVALLGIAAALMMMPACRSNNAGAGDVWADVDGHPIYRTQVEKIYHRMSSSKGNAVDKAETQIDELNILNELIVKQVLLAHAAQSGITVAESEIDTKVAQFKSPYSPEQFTEKLKEQGVTENDLREEIRTNLTIDKLLNRDVRARVSVSNADIDAYFQKNKSSFDVPETEYHLAQIEVTPGSDKDVHNLKNDDAKNPQMAQRKIQALYAQLRAGQDFATVAQNYSEDPNTALSGGDMGFYPESSLAENPALANVVKNLKVGQISGIINAKGGYHIIKLLGIEKAGQMSLSDPKVESRIRNTLTNEKEQLLKAAYIETLRDKAKVRNFLAEQIVKQSL